MGIGNFSLESSLSLKINWVTPCLTAISDSFWILFREFAKFSSLEKVQKEFKDVEIGSYPFFRAGKVGVSIVLRSEEESKISTCNEQILKFLNQKKIELIKQD